METVYLTDLSSLEQPATALIPDEEEVAQEKRMNP